jgi:hypothetical protein
MAMRHRIHRSNWAWQTVIFFALLLAVVPVAAQDDGDLHSIAVERVDAALQESEVDLAQAVMLKADILFNPKSLPRTSPFRVMAGERRPDKADYLAFYEDVYRSYEQLGKSQKDYLAAFGPELKRVLAAAAGGRPPFKIALKPTSPSAYGRVSAAASLGKLDRKEALLLQAQMLFAPDTPVTNAEFRQRPGELLVQERCLTGFYRSVHRVFAQLTPAEIAWLKSLDSFLNHLLQVKEWEAGIRKVKPRALPDPGDLDEELIGKKCVVHYTLDQTSDDACDKTYAKIVKTYMDQVISSKMPKHFRKAYHENDGDGKLHVYIKKLPKDNYDGLWLPISVVSGKKMSGIIILSNGIKAHIGAKTWQLYLKGISFHEYFHGIQSAYNNDHDLWFCEGTAVWASCYYGKDWVHLPLFLKSDDNIFEVPNRQIWLETDRKYSTSALAFYLSDKYKGYKFFTSYFLASETQDDAILNLKAQLADVVPFEDTYRNFLMALYLKAIKSIKKYMPPLGLKTYNSYGEGPVGSSIALTGAEYYVCDPQAGAKGTTLIITLKKGAPEVGNMEGFLMKDKKMEKLDFTGGKAYFTDFGKKTKQVVLIVTDVNYTTKDTGDRGYVYGIYLPYIHVNKVTAESPIFAGQVSHIQFDYDLLGVDPTNPFPGQIEVTVIAPDVNDEVTGVYDIFPGVNQLDNFIFTTAPGKAGVYNFTQEYRVPPDDWKVPQSKSEASFGVQVVLPATDSLPPTSPERPRLAPLR